ncbi:UNVERIFIED_CONTAM: Anaphase-promoting complex subunit 23 [Siphonaria sp. JEL0065]|nr:Anaphase-promoting complex subunit 23 [Siphonaria sp. JEL0065]
MNGTCLSATAASLECAMRGLFASSAWLADVALNRSEVVVGFEADANYLRAYALFNTKQFLLAADVLANATTAKGWFLRGYALLLASQAQSQSQTNAKTDQKTLLSLLAELDSGPKDGFVYFLEGLVANALNQSAKAKERFIDAVSAFPLLFAAWEELANTIVSFEQLQETIALLPTTATSASNPCYHYFLFSTKKLLSTLSEAAKSLATLQSLTNPHSTSIKLAEASMFYHHQDHPSSIHLFSQVYAENPSLLDKCDEYANALYVLEDGPVLSHLAHRCTQIDEYRPETCIAVANYYSIRGEHEKAIAYLKRAVVLDKGNSLPWTLIGHEYLELKNQAAAIEVYRRAVDINERDFRAWYALGNLYQMLKMPLYALFYFQNFDSRFWTGLASCYEDLVNFPDAIKCYKRALTVDESQQRGNGAGGGILIKLARLYDRWSLNGGGGLNASAASAAYYRRVFIVCSGLGQADGQATNHVDTLEAAEYLLRFAILANDFTNVEQYLEYVEDRGGENEKALARECRSLMNAI